MIIDIKKSSTLTYHKGGLTSINRKLKEKDQQERLHIYPRPSHSNHIVVAGSSCKTAYYTVFLRVKKMHIRLYSAIRLRIDDTARCPEIYVFFLISQLRIILIFLFQSTLRVELIFIYLFTQTLCDVYRYVCVRRSSMCYTQDHIYSPNAMHTSTP